MLKPHYARTVTPSHIVKPQPTCSHCGIPVKPLHKCPKCGRRNWSAVIGTPGAKH